MFTCILISSNYVKKNVASHFAKHLAKTQVWCSEVTWLFEYTSLKQVWILESGF